LRASSRLSVFTTKFAILPITGLAAVAGACDGELSLGLILDAVADLLGVVADDLRDDVVPRGRRLLIEGYLRRAG